MAITAEQNAELTRVGPGTPTGELLRRYWQPIAPVATFAERDTMKVRLLGEDLALFRTTRGEWGLIEARCPHRGASLAYGIPAEDGVRCMYHGWLFGRDGVCREMPNEPPESKFPEPAPLKSYPVRELGGLLFAYLGPAPAPLLPNWDLFVWGEGVVKQIGTGVIPCNYFQIMENSVDPIHGEWAHGHYHQYAETKIDVPVKRYAPRRHLKIAFDAFERGIVKRRLLEGQNEDVEDWTIGHPVLFPNMLRVGRAGYYEFQIRVPIDDENTYHIWYQVLKPAPGVDVPVQKVVPVFEMPFRNERGDFRMDTINGQDITAWVTQGPINDRTIEHIGSTDQGVGMLRRMVREQIAVVANGQDPMGTIRDERANVCIEIRQEENKVGLGSRPTAGHFAGLLEFQTPDFRYVFEQMIADHATAKE